MEYSSYPKDITISSFRNFNTYISHFTITSKKERDRDRCFPSNQLVQIKLSHLYTGRVGPIDKTYGSK